MATPDAITPIAAAHSSDTDVERGQITHQSNAPRAIARTLGQGKVPNDSWLMITDVDFRGKNQTVHKIFTVSGDGEDEVGRALDLLPGLAKGHARIYDYVYESSIKASGKSLRKHIAPYVNADDGLQKVFNDRDFRHVADYDVGDINRQWGKSLTDHESYSSIWIETLVVRKHLRRRWDGQRSNAPRWARHGLSTWIKFCAIEDDKVIVFHRHLVENQSGEHKSFPIYSLLNSIHEHSAITLSDNSQSQFIKLFLLNILSFLLRELKASCTTNFSSSEEKLELGREQVRELEERTSEKYLTTNIERSAAVVDNVQLLTNVVEYIISDLESDHREQRSSQLSPELKSLFTALRFSNKLLMGLAARNLAYDQRIWDIRCETLSVHESESVKRLTILAAFFLPLSLSSSILAMSTRLVDLHLLLYDFVGVFTILASLAILLYIVIGLGIKVARRVNVVFNFHPEREGSWKMVNYSFALIFWAMITSSFIVGMVKDVILGLKVLGYTLAGFIVLERAWYFLNWVRYRPRVVTNTLGDRGGVYRMTRRVPG